MLVYVGLSAVQINYQTFGAELGHSPTERTQITAWREAFTLGGVLVGASLPAWLTASLPEGRAFSVLGVGLVLLLVLAVLSIGSSLTRPPVFGLLSNLTSADEQGVTIGTAQSAGSLARIAGPIFAGSLYELHPAALYVTCGTVALLTALIAWRKLMVKPLTSPATIS